MNLLHLSDLHFGCAGLVLSGTDFARALVGLINRINDPDIFLLLTGDIIFRGNDDGFREAKILLERVTDASVLKYKNILLCPGNHDLLTGKTTRRLAAFDAFSYAIRKDDAFMYDAKNKCCIMRAQDILFLGINSVFHYDHTFGFVDIHALEKTLSNQMTEDVARVAFFHHHIINQCKDDTSILRNGYELIKLLERYKFRYIFHGHQHFRQMLTIGDPAMRVYGVRTVGFRESGIINGLNHYVFDTGGNMQCSSLAYSKDFFVDGVVGAFKKIE